MGLCARKQVDGVERLAYKVGCTRLGCTFLDCFRIIGASDDNDREILDLREMGASYAFEQTKSIQIWHGQVRDNQGKRAGIVEEFPCILTIDCFDCLKMVLQDFSCCNPDNPGVINNQ